MLRNMLRSGAFSSQDLGLCLPQYCREDGFVLPCSRLKRHCFFCCPFLTFLKMGPSQIYVTLTAPSSQVIWFLGSALPALWDWFTFLVRCTKLALTITAVVQVHSSGCSIYLLRDHLSQSVCQLWLFFQLALKNKELSTSLVNFYGCLHGFCYSDIQVITTVSLVVQAIKLCMCKTIYNLDDKNSLTLYILLFCILSLQIYFQEMEYTFFPPAVACDWQLDARQWTGDRFKEKYAWGCSAE